MAESILRLIKRSAEFIRIDKVSNVPKGRRGLYVLYKRRLKAGIEHFVLTAVENGDARPISRQSKMQASNHRAVPDLRHAGVGFCPDAHAGSR